MVLLDEASGVATAYSTLAAFFIVSVGYAFYTRKSGYNADEYMSARNTQGTLSLTISFFVSGAGAWILFAVPEAAILGGPIALFGYAFSCVFPLLIMAFMAPKLREKLPHGITFFEYVQARYGTVVNSYVLLISLFYMFLYLTAEFTSVGSSVDLLCGEIPIGVLQGPGLATVIGTSIVTLLYTAYGGLPVSLITDQVQGVGLLVATVLVVVAACATAVYPEALPPAANQTAGDAAIEQLNSQHANWGLATSYGVNDNPGDAVSMAVVLILAVTAANLLHTGYQQRIWSGKDPVTVRNALYAASALIVPFMLLFGFMGMVAFAKYGFTLLGPPYLAFLSAFWLIQELPPGWHVIGIMLAVSMVASSCDTIQTGITALLHPITKKALSMAGIAEEDGAKYGLVINFVITAVINIPAIILATQNISVLTLFVLADLLCATCVVPVVFGLWDRIHPIAALAGCVAGFFVALIIYAVNVDGDMVYNDEGELETPTAFAMLVEPGGLYSNTALAAFIATPLCSGAVMLLANIPFFLNGYVFDGYPTSATATAADAAEVKVSEAQDVAAA